MFHIIRFCSLTVLLLSISLSSVAAEMSEADKAKCMELCQPGPEHQALKKMVGTWDVAVKMWMDPNAPANESKGKAVFTEILDGHYVQQEYSGEMMGKPFKGIGVEGYDRVRKQYTSGWIDSMSTGIFTTLGTSSDNGKIITCKGEMADPMSGKMVPIRWVHNLVDDDHFTAVMYETRDGNEKKSLELNYVRAKQ